MQNVANGNKHENENDSAEAGEMEQSNAMLARNWKCLGEWNEQEKAEGIHETEEKRAEIRLGIRMEREHQVIYISVPCELSSHWI